MNHDPLARPGTARAADRPLRFIRRGQRVQLAQVAPGRTLAQLLREELAATGTKDGCGSGDCGACSVVLGSVRDGRMHYRVVNACIQLAQGIDGMALWTVEDLAQDPLIRPVQPAASAELHPAQEALVRCHGSQCGFCTPGFAMGLFGLYQNHVCQGRPVTRELAAQALSGNLCRCTGYRPILDAAQHMQHLPGMRVDETALLQKLQLLAFEEQGLEADFSYNAPTRLQALLAQRAAHPEARLVAGGSATARALALSAQPDVRLLDLRRVPGLTGCGQADGMLRIGAAATLSDALALLCAHWPQLRPLAARIASLPVRNAATLGGNLVQGAADGDLAPLLIALDARLELASLRGRRQLALEGLHNAAGATALAADELLTAVWVPLPAPGQLLAAHKVSRRPDNDRATVHLALNLSLDGGRIVQARIGASGVARVPMRARRTEGVLIGQPWSEASAALATAALQAEFQPPQDARASSAYRRQLLGALVLRMWRDSPGGAPAPALATLAPIAATAQEAA